MIPPPIRAARTTVAVLALALGGALASAPNAAAADYTVRYCEPGFPLQDWTPQATGAPGTVTNDCEGAGVMRVAMTNNSNAGVTGLGYELRWGATLDVVHMRARATVQWSTDSTGSASVGAASCYGSSGDLNGGLSCGLGGATTFLVDKPYGRGADRDHHISHIGLTCSAFGQICSNLSGQLEVSEVAYTFRDLAAPGGRAEVDALAVPAGGSPISGTATVKYTGTDVGGSGVLRVEARVDGQTVAATPDQCSAPYRSAQPCSTGMAGDLAVDTSRVADGPHQVDIVAIDVGRNEKLLASTRTLIQNNRTVGPGTDPELRGAPNGSSASDDARLQAWWPATAVQPSKSKRIQKRCKSKTYARRNAAKCRGRQASAKLTGRYSSGTHTLRGRLTTASGEAIAGATLTVAATPTMTGASPQPMEPVVTGPDGRWEVRVPAASGSTSITVGWLARTRDTVPAATAGARRVIHAGTSLRAPARARKGQRIKFSGQLEGAAGNAHGVVVSVQVRHRGRWRTVAAPTTSKTGRWTYRYRFASGGVYRFRALPRVNATRPYAGKASGARTVRVRR